MLFVMNFMLNQYWLISQDPILMKIAVYCNVLTDLEHTFISKIKDELASIEQLIFFSSSRWILVPG